MLPDDDHSCRDISHKDLVTFHSTQVQIRIYPQLSSLSFRPPRAFNKHVLSVYCHLVVLLPMNELAETIDLIVVASIGECHAFAPKLITIGGVDWEQELAGF